MPIPNPEPSEATKSQSDIPGLLVTGLITIVITVALMVLAAMTGGFSTPRAVSAGEARVTVPVMVHLATALPAVLLGPVILLRKKGDGTHRLLGRIWAALMMITATASAFIVAPGGGIAGTGFSPIHFFTIWTFVNVPLAIYLVRKGNIKAHRGAMTGLYVGLCIAGAFTLIPGRLLGNLVFG